MEFIILGVLVGIGYIILRGLEDIENKIDKLLGEKGKNDETDAE